ncbi:MAG: hypothetical protein IH611_04015 [Deltaproteobacteria bacterium]|nr:hypothetical protein [Deltaproteobacteria bacterium]
MALKAAYDIRCSCGAAFTGEACEYVLVEHDPELKDAILSGEFNRVFCPSCGHGLVVGNSYLYRDETNRLSVWVCGKEDEAKAKGRTRELLGKLRNRLECHFTDGAEPGTERLVFGREALIELLLREDPGLRKNEGRCLKRNPAVRLILEGRNDPGYLLLHGKKIRVAIPLPSPGNHAGPAVDPEAGKRWLKHYSAGMNFHNPYSSFLNKRLKSKWDRIRKEEPLGDPKDEFDDFAGSWAYSKVDARGFKTRYPGRREFFDGLAKMSIPRKLHSLRVGCPE